MIKKCISKDWNFRGWDPVVPSMKVDLPHDYVIHNPRDPKAPGGASNGYFTGGSGEYTKYITLGDDEHVILDIDGAYMCSRVLWNDNQLIMHPHGYTPFLVDVTEKMRKGRPNKIGITTRNVQPSTRWYSGAGLYRDVFLWTGGNVRIEPWDVFITTKSIGEKAVISVVVEITSDIDANIVMTTKIADPTGCEKVTLSAETAVKIGKNKIETEYVIESPVLWDIETPHLYKAKFEIKHGNKTEDTYEMDFGIRTVTVDAKNGLLLNDRRIKLQGGCIHHDHGAVGAASFPAAEYRKISKLKSVGFNSVRTAHNPPSLAFLEVCDRLGMLVMDEAFDMWNKQKMDLDYSAWFADWWARDIKSMVLRDRNHPCVISYSIGNEISERNGLSDGALWSQRLSDEVRKYDSTRPVTSGVCGMWEVPEENAPEEYKEDFLGDYGDLGFGNLDTSWDKWTEGYMKPLDIVGYNYMYFRYEEDHKKYPDRIMWGSETHALDFYHSWKKVTENNYVIGDFTWTAYDNLGEAGTGRSAWARDGEIKGISLAEYPWRSCYQGDFDLCGYRRPQSYFREAIWRQDCEPRIFTTHPEHYGEGFSGTQWHWYDVYESWTFEDKYIGKPVKTEVYTDADEIEFILNGKSVGTAKTEYGIATLDILYEPGELSAVSYKNGKEIKRFSVHTVGEASQIVVVPEKEELTADNRDLCYFDIFVADENGERVPYASDELTCICDGGELIAIFSGNPCNEDEYGSDKCHAFDGRAVAVVRTDKKGEVKIVVGSGNLKSGCAFVKAE